MVRRYYIVLAHSPSAKPHVGSTPRAQLPSQTSTKALILYKQLFVRGLYCVWVSELPKLNLQSSPTGLRGALPNHCVRMVVDDMGDCHQLCKKYIFFLNFIKYIPTALNAPDLRKEQCQELPYPSDHHSNGGMAENQLLQLNQTFPPLL